MTRAECIARALRRGYGAGTIKEIRRHFNVAKAKRTAKWVYSNPLNVALWLPSMVEKTFAQMAREQER